MIGITFISPPSSVEAEWPRVAALIERCVTEAVKGEFTADDVLRRALDGNVLLFYCYDENGAVTIAGALEIVRYPRKTGLSVMAMAGERLAESARDAFVEIKKFGAAMGADFIEASSPPAVARLLRSAVGFEPQYQVMRMSLGDDHVLSC